MRGKGGGREGRLRGVGFRVREGAMREMAFRRRRWGGASGRGE